MKSIRSHIAFGARFQNHHAPVDAILYGYDRKGRMILEERSFADLQELATFFATTDGSGWNWAEVEFITPTGREYVNHSAETLRSLVFTSSQSANLN